MKNSLIAFSRLIEMTTYNIISTPFSAVARGMVEGYKYYKFFSTEAQGNNTGILYKAKGIGAGAVTAILGGGLSVVREFGKALELEAFEIGYFMSSMLGKANQQKNQLQSLSVQSSNTHFEYLSELANNYLTKKLGSAYPKTLNIVSKALAFIPAGILYVFNIALKTPFLLIIGNAYIFFNERIPVLTNDAYLKNGDKKSSLFNALYSAKIYGHATIYNIIGSFSSIFNIMKEEAKEYSKSGTIGDEKSNIAVKSLSFITSKIAGIGGVLVGFVEGIADSLDFQTKSFANFLSRLQGERIFKEVNGQKKVGRELFLSNKYKIKDLNNHEHNDYKNAAKEFNFTAVHEYTKSSNNNYKDFRETLKERAANIAKLASRE